MVRFKGDQFIPKRTKVATTNGLNLEIPNHSGDNSAGTVLSSPVNDYDISNKLYVDTEILAVQVYGGIHVHDNTTSQSIPTGTTYTKITQFEDNNNGNKDVTQDATNNRLVIQKSGTYLINGSFNFESGSPNVVWRIAPFVNATEIDQIHIFRKTSSAGDAGSATMTGHYELQAGDIIDARVRHDSGGSVNLLIEYANFNLTYVGPISS